MVRQCYLITLLLGAILSCWLVWHYVMHFTLATPSNPQNPDAFVADLQVTMMDTQGKRQYAFAAPAMLHYPKEDRTTFIRPILILYTDPQLPWIAQADQGEALHGSAEVHLWGNVIAKQAAGQHNTATMITTNRATIYPQLRKIVTDQYISAVQPDAAVHSVGMQLNLPQNTLTLSSKVQGYYAQPNKH